MIEYHQYPEITDIVELERIAEQILHQNRMINVVRLYGGYVDGNQISVEIADYRDRTTFSDILHLFAEYCPHCLQRPAPDFFTPIA